MYLEAEVYGIVVVCFSLVILCSLITLAVLLWKSRHTGILWFGGQTLSLLGAFYFFYRALRFLPGSSPMYSEDQSVNIALAGVLWAVSMVCMLIGIWKLLKKGPVVYQF